MALSRDGVPLLWRQKPSAAQNVGQLVPTGSGSMDWRDVTRGASRNFLDLVRYAIAREVHEEASVKRGSSLSIEQIAKSTMVLGYFRWTRRGGKPEFYAITHLDESARTLSAQQTEVDHIPRSEFDHDSPVRNLGELREFCERLLGGELIQRDPSVPLKVIVRQLFWIASGKFGDEARQKVGKLLF